jgi:cell division transport system ATP-binding protein
MKKIQMEEAIEQEEIQEQHDERSFEEPLIFFDAVGKQYKEKNVLSNVSFSIKEGEFVSLVGSSGAGKSTILKLLYAEEFPTEGSVFFGNKKTTDIKKRLLPYYRRNFGLVFQDFKLLPNKTVFENVAFALEIDGWKTKDIEKEIPGILEVVGLEEKDDAYPHQLSGGEAQRVSMARALVHRPRVLIADEPTGNLDHKATSDIMNLLLKFNDFGATIILATHDKDIVNTIEKRVITLQKGNVIRDEERGKYAI